MTQMELLSVLREKRKAKGITLDQMSSLVGIHKCTLSEVENGNRNISLTNLLKMVEAVGGELIVV